MLIGLGVIYFLSAATLARVSRAVPRLCLFYLITGRSCPLCGLTRALGLVSQLRIKEAVQTYPVALSTLMVGSLFAARRLAGRGEEV